MRFLPVFAMLMLLLVGCSHELAKPQSEPKLVPQPPPLPPLPVGAGVKPAPAEKPAKLVLRTVEPALMLTNVDYASVYSTLPRSRWNNGSVLSPSRQEARLGCCTTNVLTNAVLHRYTHSVVTNALALNITNWAGAPAVGYIRLVFPVVTGKTYSVQSVPQPGWQWIEMHTFKATQFDGPMFQYSDWLYSADAEVVGYWRVMSD